MQEQRAIRSEDAAALLEARFKESEEVVECVLEGS
jgi:hypothetical protein